MSLHDPAGTHTVQSHGEAVQVSVIPGGIFKFYSDQKRFCPRNESLYLKLFKTRALLSTRIYLHISANLISRNTALI